MHFDHERLQVYKAAVEFLAATRSLIAIFPKGHGDLGDQLRRAATSIVLNIAEGAGEFAKRDKARFYRIARRSACECAAALDVAVQLEAADRARCEPGRALLLQIVAMLTKLVRGLDA